MTSKTETFEEHVDIRAFPEDDHYHGHLGSTRFDRRDMERMGKVQELRRNFRPLSALSFVVILQGTWEYVLTATTQGLVDGGVAGLIWSYVWTFVGMGLIILSLAEMASMAPTSGGQYHWISEFAPPRYQQFLSHSMGWMSTLSWQAGNASGPFLVGTLIQSLISVNYPDYEETRWQGTLFVFAVTSVVWVMNVWGSRAMPVFQNLMLIIHIGGFLAIVIVFWVLAPHNSAEVVFTRFTNDGGWNSMGLSLMVGQISALLCLISSDAAAHMSEEIKDAGTTVPQAILNSYLLNGGLGFIFLVSFMFCMTNVNDALKDPTGYPFIWVFRQTVAKSGLNGLSSIVIVLLFAGTLSFSLSTSRQTWAFARDGGLPFSRWIARVNPELKIPANAVSVTCLITVLLSLINIGSDVAFNAIISLNLISLMITYVVSIGCVLYRRWTHPELLPRARWSLGRWGVLVNFGAFLYSCSMFFWCSWPNSTPVDVVSFNWGFVMFLGVVIVSLLDFVFRARKVFKGPVVTVQGWRID
ncbi:amino acid permease 2 [Cadophora sp. MPI-SDFR-AT-0126]|nr:amino acid permease 2 [Leotiomycetes sp. MPI-SDFR-AT-0126]